MSTTDEITTISYILKKSERPCIVELGAYHGEDAEWMIAAVADKNPRVIMVEADPENYRIITANKNCSRATRIHAAIASHTGQCEFWGCYTDEGRGSGSIRQPTGHLVRNGVPYDFRKLPEPIPCYSLDDIFLNNGLDHIDVLWVDIQGAERDMITGGQVALAKTRFLFIESEQEELYEGQAVRPELLDLLPNWTVIQNFEHNLLLRNNG